MDERRRPRDSVPAAWAPPDDLLHDHVRIDLNDDNRVFIRLSSSGRRLASFCVSQQINVSGEWLDAVRADCSHGSVHIHYLRRDGTQVRRRELRRIYGFSDVSKGYDEAATVILDNWEEVARRF